MGATAGNAVFSGLAMLLPYLNQEFLGYPAVSSTVFALLRNAITAHHTHFTQLPHQAQQALLNAVRLAIGHHSRDVSSAGIEALAAVAKLQLQAKNSVFLQELRPFQEALFNLLLFEQISPGVLDSVADALFLLILADKDLYINNVRGFIAAQQQQLLQQLQLQSDKVSADQVQQHNQRLVDGFRTLMEDNGLTTEITRANTQKFRTNVRKFTQNIRSFLQQK
mmetsp:Transcript_17609/g.34388  ORF Transcript_17609/g.34388 Transcript_17609/m.34388 type:complete len:223 (-) Transcript_17609:183-851(-)